MVKYLFSLFVLLPTLLFSGEFTASVSRNPVNLGESFTLSLTLRDASAKGTPAIDALKKSFSIHSQQQMFNTVVVNGQVTSSTTWKYQLIPQREGEELIPPIILNTSEGIISSKPLTIRVVKAATATSDNPDTHALPILTTDVSNLTPYKNEPITYTVRIVSKRDMANISMQKVTLENAIIEKNGDPIAYQKVIDGVKTGIVEFHYLITPLKAGPLKIPSIQVEGVIPIRKKARGNFFDDVPDPFAMIQGFNQLQPFALATEEVVFDVQPPVAGINPWLPARSLTIEEISNTSQSLQVGEPFTRSFQIIAEGIQSSQLPSLHNSLVHDPAFRVYADQPEFGDEGKEEKIKSYRKEQYTFIPQQAGDLILPELSIVWWDVTKKEKVISRIPSRTLKVLAAPEDPTTSQAIPTKVEENPPVAEPQGEWIQREWLYGVIAGLVVLLLIAVIWGIILRGRVLRFKKAPRLAHSKKKKSARDKQERLPDLNPT